MNYNEENLSVLDDLNDILEEPIKRKKGNTGKLNTSKIKFDDFNDDENSQLYRRIEKDYSQFWKENMSDEYGDIGVDLVRAVKRTIFGSSKSKDIESIEVLTATFRFIVEKMCGITPEEFNTIYSTKTNKKIHVENLARKIIEIVPPETKEKCLFSQKRIIFSTVYPEYYKEKFADFSPQEIFHAKGDLKGCLIRAAKISNPEAGMETESTNEDGSFKKINIRNGVKTSYGQAVDRILFNAIEAVFDSTQKHLSQEEFRDDGFPKDDIYKRLEWFADPKNWRGTAEKNVPGCIIIIKERACYACPLDFYFLNMPASKQLEYVDDYMYIRNKAGIPREPMLEKLYSIYKNHQREIENYIISEEREM